MLRCAAVAALAAAPCAAYVRTSASDLAANPKYSFDDYTAEFGKVYAAAEQGARKAAFDANLAAIRAHNANPASTWRMGLNAFTDWTDDEFRARRTGLDRQAFHRRNRGPARTLAPADVPAEVDWREKSPAVVTPVKDQGSCGSCWAFSTAATVESAVAMATGTLLVLSPQELVSCAPNPHKCGGTGGCAGSTQPIGFNYTIDAGGLSSDAGYPYTAKTGTCDKTQVKPVAGIKGQVDLPTNDYDALISAVATAGPIAISVAAGPWKSYESGVYSGKHSMIDHAVQLVGYGTDTAAGKDYWLVRNSWGESFGEKGYIRLERFGAGKEPCMTDYLPEGGFGCLSPMGPLTIQVCGTDGVLSGSSYPTGGFVV